MLRGWMEEGRLGAGDIVPTEHALSRELGVARGTVRAALAELERTGILARRKGCRPTVAGTLRRGQEMMEDTIAILTIYGGHQHPTSSGRIEAIDAGALVSIQSKGLHALTINPERMNGEGPQKLLQARPRGVLIPDPFAVREEGQELARRLRSMGMAVVINADGPGLADIDRVISNHEEGTRRLTEWLLQRGCQRILRAWTGDERLYWLAARNRGYEAAASKAGVPLLPSVQVAGLPVDSTSSRDVFDVRVRVFAGYLVERLRGDAKPDALMMTSDAEVPAVDAACRLLGVEPNRDIVITGYDNMWRECSECQFSPTPPAATVDKFNAGIGAAMVDLLLDRIAGKLPLAAQRIVVEPKVLVPADEDSADRLAAVSG
jgi:DNA-binding LacI/PurR family transcriptional regulator